MRPSHRARRVCVALLLASTSLAGQAAVPTIALDRNAKEFGEAFSRVLEAIELPGGRILVLDGIDREIKLVDFARGTVVQAARKGAGPLEYQYPGTLFRGAKDSVVFYDWTQHRALIFDPAGNAVRSILLVQNERTDITTMVEPAAVDGAGYFYGQTTGFIMPASGRPGTEQPRYADSVVLTRVDLRTGRKVVLARVWNPAASLKSTLQRGNGPGQLSLNGIDFRAGDVWGVLSDGRVALLKNGDYQVHFLSAGSKETLGPPVAHAAVPLTTADRTSMMDSVRRIHAPRQVTVTQGGAGGPPSPSTAMNVNVLEPASWPSEKPAYLGIRVSADDRLWVSTPRPLGDKSPRYDVLDENGRLIARVVLASGERLVGLGRGAVYTVRSDNDDLQYLRRYAIKF